MSIEPTPKPLGAVTLSGVFSEAATCVPLKMRRERSKSEQRRFKLVHIGPNMMFTSVTYGDVGNVPDECLVLQCLATVDNLSEIDQVCAFSKVAPQLD